MKMLLTFIDGLDAFVEQYIPLAREYPITLLIILLIVMLMVIAFVWILRGARRRR